jgi:hypothetical protein
MQAAGAIRPDEWEEWKVKRWNTARDELDNYPLLENLLNGFQQFRQTDMVENVFFNACCFRSLELRRFEEFLSMFEGTLGDEMVTLERRARSNDLDGSASVMTEGLLIHQFALRFGPSNVFVWPKLSNGKFADLRLQRGRKSVYYEATALGTGMFEEKLRTVYSILSQSVSSYLVPRRSAWFSIDTSKLPLNDAKQLDVNMAISQVHSWLDKLGILRLLQSNSRPSVHTDFRQSYPFVFGKFIDFSIEDCPIVSLSITPDTTGMAHFTTLETFPSSGSKLGGKAFVNHIERKIREELRSAQREEERPNILVVRAYHWLYNPSRNTKAIKILDYGEVDTSVRAVFDEFKIRDLSAIKIYEHDYFQARTIVNPFASEPARLTVGELAKL